MNPAAHPHPNYIVVPPLGDDVGIFTVEVRIINFFLGNPGGGRRLSERRIRSEVAQRRRCKLYLSFVPYFSLTQFNDCELV